MIKRIFGLAVAAALLSAGSAWLGYALHREAPEIPAVNAEMEALLQRADEAGTSPDAQVDPQAPVPSSAPPEAPASATTKAPDTAASSLQPADSHSVDLNEATLGQLQELPGIGESKARAILELRAKLGRFRSVDQLREVKGIGEKTLEKLKAYIRVNGS